MNTFLLSILIISLFCNLNGQTFYRGLERMCWTNSNGKVECYDSPRKWYHENTIMVENDSIFIYKIPLHILKGKKLYSASDGAYYYFGGVIKQIGSSKFAYLTSFNCDYCARPVLIDTATGYTSLIPIYDTLKLKFEENKLQLGRTKYNKIQLTKYDMFPSKSSFYFDSNSIKRIDPKGQYGLISQGINNFLQTRELILDNDTLRICTDRFSDYNEQHLVEVLDSNLIKLDYQNIVLKFYSNKELYKLLENTNKPIRVIKINEIIEYWESARISLTYKILLPQNVKNFSEREQNNLFHYNKVGKKYELIGDLPENTWKLIERK